MARTTGIPWTDATFNAWIGCSKIGKGCDFCYAAVLDSRKRWGGETHWGPGVPRRLSSEKTRKAPLKWQKEAEAEGKRIKVFCSSLADWLDNEVEQAWRHLLFDLIAQTPNLDWQLVTKRIGNWSKFVPDSWKSNPPPNVWTIATICDQEEADRDMRKLMAVSSAVRGVSYEPAVGHVDWSPYIGDLDWIIIGGESKQALIPGEKAPRGIAPFDIRWARDLIDVTRGSKTACFVKQFGHKPHESGNPLKLKDWQAGGDPEEWPEWARVFEFPRAL